MTFQRLSILGVGLLGGSVGLAARRLSKSCQITGYGHRQESLDAALKLGAIDRASTNPAEAVKDAELVILCTPIGAFGEMLRAIGSALPTGAVVTDVGSTKRSVCQLAKELLPREIPFVGSHPMAGSEKRGVEFAREDLFRGALCITTATAGIDGAVVRRVESFWQELGMRVTRLTPEDHDRMLADVSHLPHAVAAALVAMQSDMTLPMAGKGFLDSTRIAGGDGGLWRDIFLDNSDNLRDSIRKFRIHLDRLESMLDPKKTEELKQWLNAAAQKRRGFGESAGSE